MAMIEDTWERLMQDELEGVASPGDSVRLHAWLAGDAAGRARFTELRSLFEALGRVALAEAPAGIRDHVEREISAGSRLRPRRAGWFADLESAFRRHTALRYAYPLAAGGIAGILAFSLLSTGSGPRDLTRLPVTGTMSPASPDGRFLPVERLDVNGATLTLETRQDDSGVDLRIAGHSSRPVKIVVAYDHVLIHSNGFVRKGPEARQVVLLPGQIQLEGMGSLDYSLHFDLEPGHSVAPVRVSLLAGADQVERSFRLSPNRP
jgi:hypothetical protein